MSINVVASVGDSNAKSNLVSFSDFIRHENPKSFHKMVRLYHYTSWEKFDRILSENKIEGYTPHFGNSSHPWGVYLTELHPSKGTMAIVMNNFAILCGVDLGKYNQLAAKTAVALEFDHWRLRGIYRNWDAGMCINGKRNEWVYRHDVHLSACNRVWYDNAWHQVSKGEY